MTDLSVHHSSVKQDWQTPDEVLDVVRQCGPIGLDPCTVASNPTGAMLWSTPHDDGLITDWSACIRHVGGNVFMNPPYGRECKAWVAKAIEEGEAGCPIITLTAARPDSRWGQALLSSADAVCWWRGRIRFRGAPHPAPFPSLFAAFNVPLFAETFTPHGVVMVRGGRDGHAA